MECRAALYGESLATHERSGIPSQPDGDEDVATASQPDGDDDVAMVDRITR